MFPPWSSSRHWSRTGYESITVVSATAILLPQGGCLVGSNSITGVFDATTALQTPLLPLSASLTGFVALLDLLFFGPPEGKGERG